MDAPRKKSYSERRSDRFQRRVEVWEERRRHPAPRQIHRTIVLAVMMLMMLALLALLLSSPTPVPPA